MKACNLILLFALVLTSAPRALAQDRGGDLFDDVELLVPRGDKADTVSVRMRLGPDALTLESRKTGVVLKTLPYADIKSAESSYSKHPRWKAGVGTAAGSVLLAPVFLIALPFAIPLAFSKSKRHWLTVRSGQDYAVLKLDKDDRKFIIPAFEVRSGVTVEAVGQDK